MDRGTASILVGFIVILSACANATSVSVDDPDDVIAGVDFLAPDELRELTDQESLTLRQRARWSRLSSTEVLLHVASGQCWDDVYTAQVDAAAAGDVVVFDVEVSGSECEGGDQVGLRVQIEESHAGWDVRVRQSRQCKVEGCP